MWTEQGPAPEPGPADPAQPSPPTPGQHRRAGWRGARLPPDPRRARRTRRIALGLASALVFGASGFAWWQYHGLLTGIHTSGALGALGGAGSANGDTNILIMGLDTRLDENGNPLPADIYDALHAGDQTDGGNNANVLMLLHVPGNGARATALSIPRDDYVDLVGCPDGTCKGKIKQAYGLAFDQKSRQLAGTVSDPAQREQADREAGREAEIATVSQFLGGVPVDHFVEVTLVAFFQLAQAVQPITVCLNEDTQDSYSGANFHAGQQQINAAQALAFVRQRRDTAHPALGFTDLDRERRQQAFIAALAYQLKQAGTFANPSTLATIMSVAKQNAAIDSGLDLLSFAQQASNLTSGNITFYTLPVDHFGTDPGGESVNIVDLPRIQATVRQLLTDQGPAAPAPTTSAAPSTEPADPAGAVVDAVNASARNGLAGRVERDLVGRGFVQGTASTQHALAGTSLVEYGPGSSGAAASVARLLGVLTVRPDSTVSAGTVRVVLGTDFALPDGLGPTSTVSAAPATATNGTAGPPPTALSALSGGGIPCVK